MSIVATPVKLCSYVYVFFFFKQKTAYEMRISDWSSDVCSSDLLGRVHVDVHHRGVDFEKQHEGRMPTVEQHVAIGLAYRVGHQFVAHQIGRASCRERVCQYV